MVSKDLIKVKVKWSIWHQELGGHKGVKFKLNFYQVRLYLTRVPANTMDSEVEMESWNKRSKEADPTMNVSFVILTFYKCR